MIYAAKFKEVTSKNFLYRENGENEKESLLENARYRPFLEEQNL